jgi:hypothetical protein
MTIKPEMKIQPKNPRLRQGDSLAGMNRYFPKIVLGPTPKFQRSPELIRASAKPPPQLLNDRSGLLFWP